VRQLLVQQLHELEVLHIRGPRAYLLLEGLAASGGCKVRHLYVTIRANKYFKFKSEEAHAVARALLHGDVVGVKGIEGYIHPSTLGAITKGACPDLRRLCFNDFLIHEYEYARATSYQLTQAFRSGHLKNLRELQLSPGHRYHFPLITHAMSQYGPFPFLTDFKFTTTTTGGGGVPPLFSAEDLQALAHLVASGACPRLQKPPITLNDDDDDDDNDQ